MFLFFVNTRKLSSRIGGVYSTFGGHDASRGLATFSVSGKDEYDDLSDLNSLELESMLEWETQFLGKYIRIV